jgi:hypothetical protein
MRNIGITLGLALLPILAAVGLGGMVGYLQHKYPSTVCMALDLIGLCK